MRQICITLLQVTVTVAALFRCDGIHALSTSQALPSQPKECRRLTAAKSLRKELIDQGCQFHDEISLIFEGKDECGVVLSEWKFGSGSQNSDIVFVPRHLFLTPTLGFESILGGTLHGHLSLPENAISLHQEKLPHIYLSLYLCLYQRSLVPTSKTMDLYFESLPRRCELRHLPIFWSAENRATASLELLKSVQTRKEEWENEFRVLYEAFSSIGCVFELEDWLWARSVVTSRAFTDNSCGIEESFCLCPYVDMLNHCIADPAIKPDENVDTVLCQWKIDNDGYRLSIPEDLNKVDSLAFPAKLEISYGEHTAEHFLLNYGFTPPREISN